MESNNEGTIPIPDEEEDEKKPQAKHTDSVEEWPSWTHVMPTKSPHAPPPVSVKTSPGPEWDIGQVLKAGQLLCKPPLNVEFADEQEMRHVYSIIYDVFRYKTILDQAIDDTEFFIHNPQYTQQHHIIWLFLMELARRRWGSRAKGETDRATKLLAKAGSPFKEIEAEIWQQRVHFAAAIARIRIKNKAFSLSDLLPSHLREERISACVNKDSVTGWVNTFKAKKVALLVKHLHDLGYNYSHSRQLCAGEYRFDRVCPRFITLRPPNNMSIGQLDLVRDGVIVLQEREFCEGASTLCRALRTHSLRGVVAQTHASSPRCSAYLAAQLRELAAVLRGTMPAAPATPELGRLVVFGAGDRVGSYVLALRELGIEASEAPQFDAPVCVLSEQVYCESPVVTNALKGVVAVLATPPNSYSAVTDPIDLVCGRGGDLAMLEVLTESEIDSEGKSRVQSILEEQKKTLRTLMSKPQIQLILYETHSALEAENQAQVTRAVAEANRLARERHAFLKRRHRTHSPQKQAIERATTPTDTTNLDSSLSQTDIENDQLDDLGSSQPSPKRPSSYSKRPPSGNQHHGRPQSVPEPARKRPPSGSNPPPVRQPSLSSSPPITNRNRPHSEDLMKRRMDSLEVGSRPGTNKARPIPEQPQPNAMPKDPDQDNPNIFVPDCDLFELGILPGLGNGLDLNYILDRDGCYLGLIQRKEITRLDAKYMIRVAEERGLFGSATPAPQPARRKKPEVAATTSRGKKRKNSFEVERLTAPTYASLSRSARRSSEPSEPINSPCCERHARRHAAAAAYTAAACICDQRHRTQYRRASADGAIIQRPAEVPCRRPFPLVVHELRLKPFVPPKMLAYSSI